MRRRCIVGLDFCRMCWGVWLCRLLRGRWVSLFHILSHIGMKCADLIDCEVTKFGYSNPWLFLSGSLTAVSGGMLSTFKTTTGNVKIDGILVLCGSGAALATQMVCSPSSLPSPSILLTHAAHHSHNGSIATKRHLDRHGHIRFLPVSGTASPETFLYPEITSHPSHLLILTPIPSPQIPRRLPLPRNRRKYLRPTTHQEHHF